MSAEYVLVGLVAYLLGSINFAIIICKRVAGIDIREKGSKNAGTTNVLRTVGKGAALLTLILDVLKGVVAVLFAMLVSHIWEDNVDPIMLNYLAGLMAILGHTFPIYYGFRGGKGVATSLGVLLVVDFRIGLICLAFALIMIAVTRWVSFGSICAAILFPILTIVLVEDSLGAKIISVIMALLVIFNHRTNIVRLREGTENKLSFK